MYFWLGHLLALAVFISGCASLEEAKGKANTEEAAGPATLGEILKQFEDQIEECRKNIPPDLPPERQKEAEERCVQNPFRNSKESRSNYRCLDPPCHD